MRLIDADALWESIEKDRAESDMPKMWHKGIGYAIYYIIHAPTVSPDMAQVLAYECGKDSVQVVQCKDCIHNQVATRNHGIRDNPRCNFTNYVRSNEFFCGFGERRSE